MFHAVQVIPCVDFPNRRTIGHCVRPAVLLVFVLHIGREVITAARVDRIIQHIETENRTLCPMVRFLSTLTEIFPHTIILSAMNVGRFSI